MAKILNVTDLLPNLYNFNEYCITVLHFSESPIYKPQHRMHMLQLGVGKNIVTILAMAIQSATEVIHRVADTLQFGYLAQHQITALTGLKRHV